MELLIKLIVKDKWMSINYFVTVIVLLEDDFLTFRLIISYLYLTVTQNKITN